MNLKQSENISYVTVNANSIAKHVIQMKKWNNEPCQCECKNYHKCKEDYSWNSNICICDNSKYLWNIGDTSVIACDEFISVMGIESTKMTNIIAINLSINSNGEKVR